MPASIIHPSGDGGVVVTIPAEAFRLEGEDDDAFVDRVRARVVPDGTPFSVINTSVLPPMSTRSRWRWNDDGTISVADEDIAALKATLKARVDTDAEAQRLRYVTPGAGMAMTYEEKHAQARAVAGLGETAANALTDAERTAQFPILAASVGIEAETLWACSLLVIQRYEAFADIGGAIERIRLTGKKAISDASDAAGARAAYEAVTWTQ